MGLSQLRNSSIDQTGTLSISFEWPGIIISNREFSSRADARRDKFSCGLHKSGWPACRSVREKRRTRAHRAIVAYRLTSVKNQINAIESDPRGGPEENKWPTASLTEIGIVSFENAGDKWAQTRLVHDANDS